MTQTTTQISERVEERGGRFFIRLGFPGFNSPANNRSGYATATAAEQASLRFSAKGARRG